MDSKLSWTIIGGVTLILIVVPLIYSSHTQDSFSLPKKAFFQISTAVLLCVFAVQIVVNPERLTAHRTPADTILLLWLAWNVLASFLSIDSSGSMRELIYLSCLTSLFFLITRNATTATKGWLLIGAIILMAVLEASYGIAERLGVKLLYEKDILESSLPVTAQGWRGNILGTFGNANHLASYLVLSAPLLLGCLILSAYSLWYVFLPCLIVVLGCLVLTGARAAWLAAFIGLSFLALLGFRQSRKIGLSLAGFASLMLIGVIILILFTQPNLITEITGRVTESFNISTGSFGYRLLAWRLAFNMIEAHPVFGSGPGTFKILFLPALADYLRGGDPLSIWHISEKMNEPHNEYLQIAVETGITGLLVFLLFIFAVIQTGWQNLGEVLPPTGFLASALLASFIGVLAHAFASIPFHVVPTFVTFWALVSLFLSLLRPSSSPPPQPSCRRLWPWLLMAGLFAFSGLTLHETYREIKFSYLFKVATTHNHMERFNLALPYFEQANKIDPHSGRLKFYYGSTLIHLGRYAEGIALLEESKRNFQDIYIYKNLGIAHETLGKYDEAIEYYNRWREIGIASYEANNQIASIRLRQGRVDEAEELFKETLRVRPWDWTAHSKLGILQMDSGRLEEAIETLQPDVLFWYNPDAYSLYGVALLKAGLYKDTAKSFFAALSGNPNSVRAHNNLAALYYKTGEIDAAIREWRKVLELDPENEIARKNLQTAQEKSKLAIERTEDSEAEGIPNK